MCRWFYYRVSEMEEILPVGEGWKEVSTIGHLRALSLEYDFKINDVKDRDLNDQTDYTEPHDHENSCLCPFDLKKILGIITYRAVDCIQHIEIHGR